MKIPGSVEGSLSDAVTRSLRQYLVDLEGEKPSDLYGIVLKEVERPMLEVIMAHTAQNQSRAAQMLGINRNTLRKKLKAHGLDGAGRRLEPSVAPAAAGPVANSVDARDDDESSNGAINTVNGTANGNATITDSGTANGPDVGAWPLHAQSNNGRND